MLVVGLLVWSGDAFAYRPFDTTDAAVADLHAVEIELSPLSYRHDNDGTALIAPSLRLNYGFAKDWEVVLEGEANHFSRSPSQLSEAMLSVKTVLRAGSLQGQSGLSLGSEAAILLPGVGAQNGAGLEWTGIASQRWDWGTIHFNLAASLTREQHGAVFTGLILEGPDSWVVRPVAEFTYDHEFGGEEEVAGLLGAIWQLRDNFAFDFGLRHARMGGQSDDQIRAGVTFDLP